MRRLNRNCSCEEFRVRNDRAGRLSLSVDEQVDDAEGEDLFRTLEDVDVGHGRIDNRRGRHLPGVKGIRNFGVFEDLRDHVADLADVLDVSGQSSAEKEDPVLDADPG